MSLRATSRRVKLSLLLGSGGLAAAASLAFVLATSSGAASIPLWTTNQLDLSAICSEDAGTTPEFDLTVKKGHIQTPDGNAVFMWGFTHVGPGPTVAGGTPTGNGKFQMPGPILCVEEGDTVTVNLSNPGNATGPGENVSIVFPGQTGVTTSGGDADGLFTREVAPGGTTVSYTFTADEPGTYLYESGTNPVKQIEMGLYGAIVVRPSAGANFAYNDANTEFDPNREYLLLMHDIDPFLHQAVERGQTFDITTKRDRYWTINGRSFPDTISNHFATWLPEQPYGAFVWVEALDQLSDKPALIRYANAGSSNHPFHPHGDHVRIVGRDGRLLGGSFNFSMEGFNKTIGSGQTYDGLFIWEDLEGWTDESQIPVQPRPDLRNLVFADDFTGYSGDATLGNQGDLPASVTTWNQCGEFYFPMHSHALNEFQNFNEGFGGLATLLRVDPPGGCTP